MTMLPYHFVPVRKRNNTCAFIVKERKRQIVSHFCNMNKSEAANMRCSINRWSIIYYNLTIA